MTENVVTVTADFNGRARLKCPTQRVCSKRNRFSCPYNSVLCEGSFWHITSNSHDNDWKACMVLKHIATKATVVVLLFLKEAPEMLMAKLEGTEHICCRVLSQVCIIITWHSGFFNHLTT